jgi:drug/metabolite transporter (DMT)-like permease
MTLFALALVLVAAVLHATWNMYAKRAGGGLPFVWVSGVVSLILWTPLAAVYWWRHPDAINRLGLLFIVASGVLHCGYSIFLQRAYRAGDFTLVYPLARGTGPLISSLCAIAFLGERPTPLALAGGALIIGSIFYLTGGPRLWQGHAQGKAIGYGLGCGVFIASYTVVDQQGVTLALVPPLLLDWGGNVARTALFAPLALRRRAELADVWRKHKDACLAVAVLGPLAYILVLWALTFTPLTYIAPVREVSILFGAFIGARLFKEVDGRRRVWAALVMAAGVIALAVG